MPIARRGDFNLRRRQEDRERPACDNGEGWSSKQKRKRDLPKLRAASLELALCEQSNEPRLMEC
jgi:hypothetical protein